MKVCLTDSLKRAVDAKSIAAARSAILTELRDDRTREVSMALTLADLVSKELPGLYEPDNGLYSSPSDSLVTEDLWTKARSAMMLNFSRERLCFIETIVGTLRQSPPKDPFRRGKLRTSIVWLSLIVIGIIVLISTLVIYRKGQGSLPPVDSGNNQRASKSSVSGKGCS